MSLLAALPVAAARGVQVRLLLDDTAVPLANYRPTLAPEGRMGWPEARAYGAETVYQQEPGASWLDRVMISVVGLLPAEWMF